MARKVMTRREALERARERSAKLMDREKLLVQLIADWEQANDQMIGVYARMYRAGLTRTEIAGRLGLSTARVPKADDEDVASVPLDDDTNDNANDDAEGASEDADGDGAREVDTDEASDGAGDGSDGHGDEFQGDNSE